MVGSKGRSFSSKEDEDVYRTQGDNENYANSTQQNAQGIGSGVFDDQSGYGNFPQSGRDQRNASLDGSLFRGNIGFLLQSAFIDSTTNTLNLLVDQNDDPIGKEVSADRIPIISSGTTVDLITIIGAERPGQRLAIYGIFGNTITLIHNSSGTENTILCPGNVNFTLTDTEIVELFYDTTTTQWRILGTSSNGGGGDVTFPILYPKEDLNPSIGGTATIDLAINTGNAKQIQFPAGNISFEISDDPSSTVAEDVYVMFIQDSTGGRTLTTVDTAIKNGDLINAEIDPASGAKTVFRLATLDGGTSYHVNKVDLTTAAGGLLSTLAIDTDKDWAARFITNLAGIDLFANSVANSVTNASIVSFISDGSVPRGEIGRSDFFGTSQGTTINLPGSTSNFVVSEDGTEAFKINFTTDSLFTFNLDVNIEDDTTNALLTLFRNETGADDNDLGTIFFKGQDDVSNPFQYSFISSVIENATNGQEAASIRLGASQGANIAATTLIVNADNSRILRWQSDDIIDLVAPVFEFLATTDFVETGVNTMGQINFDATTNDGAIIQPVETFAQIIVDQEDADIATESGSMRFRVRDKTSTVGALKTYLEFNRVSSGIIEALKDVTLENLTQNPVLTLFRNETGATDNRLGTLIYKGQTTSGGDFTFSEISSTISDSTLGQEDSIISLSTTNDGIFSNVELVVNADSSQILRFSSQSPSSTIRSPVHELLATTSVAPPTGANQRIGEINFEVTTNDAGGVGQVETFAQIIVDQEESDITNESGSLRFRVRDQTGAAGSIKTYLQFNDNSSGQIQSLKDFDLGANFMQFDELAEPADATIDNSEGNVFFDDSTDPPVLKIKKKDSVGAVSLVSLEGAGGGVAFPIRPPVTTGLPTTGLVTLDLNQTSGHYFDIGTLTGNINISITNPPASGTAQAFRINIVKGVTDFTVTFNDTLLVTPIIGGANTTTLLAGDIYDGSTFNIFTMTSTAGSGGGGVSFPIIPPVSVRGNVSTTQNIDLSLSIAHSTTMTLTASISITFSNFPTTGNQIEWEVQITQDGTGGHIVTWPAEVTNPPVLDTTADSIAVVSLRTNDGGTTVRVGNTVTTTGGGGDVSQWATFTAVQDIDYGTFDGINIDRLLFDQATGEVLTATDIGITSDATGNLNFNSLDEYNFDIDGTPAIKFEDAGSAVLRLDVLNHTIINAKDIIFDLGATFEIANAEAGIGTDGTLDELIYNVPSTWEQKWKINGAEKVTLNVSSLSLEPGFRLILQPNATNAGLRLGAVSGNPSTLVASDLWFDSAANQFKGRDNSAVVVLGGDINTITSGNSNVTVTDPGTGLIQFTADNVLITQMQNNRMDFQNTDIFGVAAFSFEKPDLSSGTVLTQNQNDFTMNFPDTADDFIINFNSVQGFIVDEFLTRVSSTNPSTTKAVFELFRDDPNPSALEDLGEIKFQGRNSIGSLETYGTILSFLVDPTNTIEQADMFLKTLESGILVDTFAIGGGSATIRHFTGVPAEFARLRLQKDDASPGNGDSIGVVDFGIIDSDVTTNYARIEGLIDNTLDSGRIGMNVLADGSLTNALLISGDDNNAESFLTVNSLINSSLEFGVNGGSGGTFNIGPIQSGLGAGIELGIVVQDNISYTVGSNGTIAIPITGTLTATAAGADAAFGSHDGAVGFFDNGVDTFTLFARQLNGNWGTVILTRDVLT